jgi:hypothetical protein
MRARTRSALSSCSVLLLGATLLLTLAAPAQADRWAGRDPRGDVSGWSFSPEPPPCGSVVSEPAPENVEHDLTRVAVAHRGTTVQVTVHFRDLRRASRASLTIGLRTPGKGFELTVDQRREAAAAPRVFFGTETQYGEVGDCGIVGGISEGLGCRDLEARISPRQDTATVRIPRRCLGDPRWVRAAVDVYALGNDAGGSDHWGPAGSEPRLRGFFGPKVRRG